jgi:hypothetical protein
MLRREYGREAIAQFIEEECKSEESSDWEYDRNHAPFNHSFKYEIGVSG